MLRPSERFCLLFTRQLYLSLLLIRLSVCLCVCPLVFKFDNDEPWQSSWMTTTTALQLSLHVERHPVPARRLNPGPRAYVGERACMCVFVCACARACTWACDRVIYVSRSSAFHNFCENVITLHVAACSNYMTHCKYSSDFCINSKACNPGISTITDFFVVSPFLHAATGTNRII